MNERAAGECARDSEELSIMSHRSDREDSSFPLLESGKAEKLTSPGFRESGKSSGKREKLTGFPREDLFRGVGKAQKRPQTSATDARVLRAWDNRIWP